MSVRAALEADYEPLGTPWFGRLRSGRLRNRFGREEVPHQPGEVFLTAEPGSPSRTSPRDLACDVAVLDPVVLVDRAAEPPEPLGHPHALQSAPTTTCARTRDIDEVGRRPEPSGRCTPARSPTRPQRRPVQAHPVRAFVAD
ncbi:hypothetical protein [Nonomuraea sp. NPDC005692]|uniref:hypothetical protein n=1 Tax=Nonomuraea sp. NPDC005692 TaxID=3157168 RepID=UPI0033F3C419